MNQAISYAAYRAAADLFPGNTSSVFDPLMRTLGYDASDRSTDTSAPTGIGNVAAQAVLGMHHRDGANQLAHNDRFGASVTCPRAVRGSSPGAVPASAVTLSWRTFSDAANQAGISRRYGGIHFEQGDVDARATGRLAARRAWEKAQDYWEGR